MDSAGPPDVSASKDAWRTWAATVDRGRHSSAVCAALAAWPPLHGVVAAYLPMRDEIDVSGVFELERCRVVVPRIEPDRSLTLHDLRPDSLVRHDFGMLEPPAGSEPVPLDVIDVVLVPGLVFDRDGNRIGRGGGMYDRLLDRLPIGVARVGVAVDEVVVAELPVEGHDQHVDWLATESGVVLTDRELAPSSRQVVTDAVGLGVPAAMIHFPEGTKTSQDAARAVDAELGSIAKSLVFLVDDEPVLVICSGDRRVDERRLAGHFGASTARPAPLDLVREVTGYVAGGTPAFGHHVRMPVVADVSLCRYRWVWSAGGTPDTVYPVSLERLVAASGARWADIADRG